VGLPCLSCREEVEEGKFFEKLFLCPECQAAAHALHHRFVVQLQLLLEGHLTDLLKQSLVAGKFTYRSASEVGAIAKEDVLRVLLELSTKERRDTTPCPPPPPTLPSPQSSTK